MERIKRYEGEKTYLSALQIRDAETIVKWYNNPAVTQYGRMHRDVLSLHRIREMVTEMTKSGEAFAIFDKAGDILIGYGIGNEELNLFIGETDFWDTGHDEEALEFLLDFVFNVGNHHIITVCAYEHNTRALACYAKAGLKKALV